MDNEEKKIGAVEPNDTNLENVSGGGVGIAQLVDNRICTVCGKTDASYTVNGENYCSACKNNQSICTGCGKIGAPYVINGRFYCPECKKNYSGKIW